MNSANLLKIVEPIPMLRMVVPMGMGILFAGHFTLPAWFVLGIFVFAGVVALLLRSWIYTLVALMAFGVAITQIHTVENAMPMNRFTTFEVVVQSPPTDFSNRSTANAMAVSWRDSDDGSWRAVRHKIVLNIDSTLTICAGERLVVHGSLRPFTDSSSYGRLMMRRGYCGRLWVSTRSVVDRMSGGYSTLHLISISRLRSMGLQGAEDAICRAMAAGDRSSLTPEIRQDFARSGFSHLLAVSGLHVAIVFGLINLLLWWLPLFGRGHLIRNLLSAVAIWLFVAAAGFAPSAVRAAIMFSLLQFALARSSLYVGGNALCSAAFLMLLYDPNYLYDISFQLSFIAVGAILAWGIPLSKICRTPWRVVNWLLSGLIISVVATISTAPLVSHAFGIVPFFGVLLNPFAILLASIVVLGGVVWMLFPITVLAPFFCFVVGGGAQLLNKMAHICASNSLVALQYSLSERETWVAYLILLLITALIGCRDRKKIVHLSS